VNGDKNVYDNRFVKIPQLLVNFCLKWKITKRKILAISRLVHCNLASEYFRHQNSMCIIHTSFWLRAARPGLDSRHGWRVFCSLPCKGRFWGPPSLLSNRIFLTEKSGRTLKMTVTSQLVKKLRSTHGVLLHSVHTPSWSVASYRANFTST
jgi:hypothetical protein